MKSMFSPIAFLALSLLAVPDTLNALTHQTDEDRASEVQMNSGAREREVPAEILTIQPDVPRGPNEILASYEGEMASITSRISDELGEIVEAVGSGQLSIRQGESLARERYQMATMQFELLSAWHAILQHAVDEARAVPTPPQPLLLLGKPGPGAAISSLPLNSSLARYLYLDLTPEQSSAIWQVMAQEHPKLEPLLAQELDEAFEERDRNRAAAARAGQPENISKRLLLVDDETSIRAPLPPILQQPGFDVNVAASVPETLQKIQNHNFDALLSDLNMGQPGDGFTVVHALREVNPRCVAIILTGYPGFESAGEGVQEKIDDYIVKPADIDLLISKMQRRLAQRRAG